MTDTPAAPAAPERGADTPMANLIRLARVPFSPGAVFGELQNRPAFWTPWIGASVVLIIIGWLQRPFQQRLTQIFLERLGRTAPAESPVKMVASMLGAPILLLVVLVISAAILYGLSSAMGGETTYKKMLSVVVYALPPILLQQLVTVVVLMSRGVASITGPSDMFVSLGADLALPADAQVGYFTRFFLAGIGPLQIWSLVIVAVGLMVMAKNSKGSAWTAAIIHFLIILCAVSALTAFGASMMAGATGGAR